MGRNSPGPSPRAAASVPAAEPSGPPKGNGPPAPATVTATIRLQNSRLLARFISAPVSVAITTQQARNVLALPVSALLARPEGGYAVTVVDESGDHDVPVSTGLYSDTLVQINGPRHQGRNDRSGAGVMTLDPKAAPAARSAPPGRP